MTTISTLPTQQSEIDVIYGALAQVMDPEIPFISVLDLGIITGVEISETGITVMMTPTFSGCPALLYLKKQIEEQIRKLLPDENIVVNLDLTKQWSSNLISEKGIEALKKFDLAPPQKYTGEMDPENISNPTCPHCGSKNTSMKSMFGSTLCRSIHYCFDCKQSFEQFKAL
jgi:ring-1,2-phenylacetyl-CoA epoxidase subunit PaaD